MLKTGVSSGLSVCKWCGVKAAPLLAFRLLNLYRTAVRRRDLKDKISRRFSASAQTYAFVVISLAEKTPLYGGGFSV